MLCLQVPTGLRGQALLKVWGRDWRVEEGPLFHNQTSVTVDSRGASVFIQTDKPVYRPKHRGGRPARAAGGGMAMDGSCHTPLSFLPVLISIFTVTPDLRPTSEKVRLASKTVCLGLTHRGPAWPGPSSTTCLSSCLFQFLRAFLVSSQGSTSAGGARREVCVTERGQGISGSASSRGPHGGQWLSIRAAAGVLLEVG